MGNLASKAILDITIGFLIANDLGIAGSDT